MVKLKSILICAGLLAAGAFVKADDGTNDKATPMWMPITFKTLPVGWQLPEPTDVGNDRRCVSQLDSILLLPMTMPKLPQPTDLVVIEGVALDGRGCNTYGCESIAPVVDGDCADSVAKALGGRCPRSTTVQPGIPGTSRPIPGRPASTSAMRLRPPRRATRMAVSALS